MVSAHANRLHQCHPFYDSPPSHILHHLGGSSRLSGITLGQFLRAAKNTFHSWRKKFPCPGKDESQCVTDDHRRVYLYNGSQGLLSDSIHSIYPMPAQGQRKCINKIFLAVKNMHEYMKQIMVSFYFLLWLMLTLQGRLRSPSTLQLKM